jgi:hypothetical protein
VALLALGPTNKRTKMQALNVLLAFIKAKPAERIAARTTPDEWLHAVAAAAEAGHTQDPQSAGYPKQVQ